MENQNILDALDSLRVRNQPDRNERSGHVLGVGNRGAPVARDAVRPFRVSPETILADIKNAAKAIRRRSAIVNAASRVFAFVGTFYGAAELYYKVAKAINPNTNTRINENDSVSTIMTKANLQSNVKIRHKERALNKAIGKAIIQSFGDECKTEMLKKAIEKLNNEPPCRSSSPRAQLDERRRERSSISR